MSIAEKEVCHMKRGSYMCLPSESNGPNLLDETFKWLYMVFDFLGLTNPCIWKIMTHSESVHLCAEFNKLVY
jgi:hypothetical protein